MKQNKAPVLAALELIEKNLEFMNRHKNGNDFFMGLYDENHDTRADLQKWVDDVPYEAQEYVELYDKHLENSALTPIMRAAKHLLKGIKNDR